MNDNLKNQRSYIMKRNRSKGNKSTELKLLSIFMDNNITGWRRNYPVEGHPDFVFLKIKIAIFVDGCFWHGHDCRNTIPKDNYKFWDKKREYNMRHDIEITKLFEKRGWTVIRIWECELKKNDISKLHTFLTIRTIYLFSLRLLSHINSNKYILY